MSRPDWQLPPGVPRALWHYAQSDEIAESYDEFFEHTQLLSYDVQCVIDELADQLLAETVVADLGCGTGRIISALMQFGGKYLAVDLSQAMLDEVLQKTTQDAERVIPIQSNLVTLQGISSESVNHATCMFATLGMIQGKANRQQAVDHMARILKPGGKLILHVHNFWYSLRDRKGIRWVLGNLINGCRSRGVDVGDRVFNYRGIPNMFHHSFRWRELSGILKDSGLKICNRICLNQTRAGALKLPWLLPGLRSNGWIVVCQRS